jgi:DNA-binding CsgD family transcriptional regulator
MYKTLTFNAVTRLNYLRSEDLGNDIDHIFEISSGDESMLLNDQPPPYILLGQLEKLFSKREREVLLWMAEGLSSKMIADKLHISEHTVINHRRSMQEKSNKPNATALVSFAIRNGII